MFFIQIKLHFQGLQIASMPLFILPADLVSTVKAGRFNHSTVLIEEVASPLRAIRHSNLQTLKR